MNISDYKTPSWGVYSWNIERNYNKYHIIASYLKLEWWNTRILKFYHFMKMKWSYLTIKLPNVSYSCRCICLNKLITQDVLSYFWTHIGCVKFFMLIFCLFLVLLFVSVFVYFFVLFLFFACLFFVLFCSVFLLFILFSFVLFCFLFILFCFLKHFHFESNL